MRPFVVLFALAGLSSLSLHAQPPGPGPAPLSLAQAVDKARMDNPTLASMREHVSAIKANEITAGLRLNPTLQLLGQGMNLPRINPSGGNTYFYSANLSRTFERGEKRRWRLSSAQATTAVTEDEYEDQERETLLNVKLAFTSMLLAKESLRFTQENLDDYRHQVDLANDRLKAGDISGNDFERIDLQLAGFERDEDAARLSLLQASQQLQTLLGAAQPSNAFDITGTLAPPDVVTTLDEVEQRALTSRPDLHAAEQGVRVAEAESRLANSMAKVDPTLAGEYELNGPQSSVGASLTLPLRIFDRNQGERARTRYEAQSSRLAETAARSQVASDVAQAWAAYQTAVTQARRYASRYVGEAQRVRDNLQFSYQHGGSTLIDYLQALHDYRQTNLDALNANAQVWTSLHQLSFAAASEIVP